MVILLGGSLIMLQKIIRVGNSYAVTIPRNILDSFGTKKTNFVNIYEEPEKKRVVISFAQEQSMEEIVDPEVYRVARKLLKRYLPAFKELAKR